jgi:hypothetical protein
MTIHAVEEAGRPAIRNASSRPYLTQDLPGMRNASSRPCLRQDLPGMGNTSSRPYLRQDLQGIPNAVSMKHKKDRYLLTPFIFELHSVCTVQNATVCQQ